MPPIASTPMLRHYLEVKAQHPDAIVFYRMGDFFELFYEDAEVAAPVLEVTLTARQKGTENEAPMCGVPHHALEVYAGKLLRQGFKVAVCDQVEDPREARGLVRREVVRVLTPGTLSEPELLEGTEENLLASVGWADGQGGGAFLDVSTGAFFLRRWGTGAEAVEDLEVLRPRELLAGDGELPPEVEAWAERSGVCLSGLDDDSRPRGRRAAALLREQLGTATLQGFGLADEEPLVEAAAAAVAYARQTQRNDLAHVRTLTLRDSRQSLVLDPTTLANLEVLRSQREGGRRGSLLGVLDHTLTPLGGRLLKDWLRRPLRDRAAIAARHAAVAALLPDAGARQRLRGALGAVADLERLAGRAVLGSLSPREAGALRDSLLRAPAALAEAAALDAALLVELASVDPLPPLADELARSLAESPPARLEDGGVIAEGVDAVLDEARSLARDSKRHILALEARERERTGIGSLKIRYNRVFGYFLEVTRANQHLVPDDYVRRQTLANAERYVTAEVKELEEKILAAEERQAAREGELYRELVGRIAAAAEGLRRLAGSLASLDVLASFAEVAARHRYCRPEMGEPGEPIVVREGRHPVVEALVADPFVPNDVELDGERCQIVVLTGPNMGGKSTYLRQAALVVLMAHAGSFVPAASARIGVVDRIFTRVGASDDLARGESTFMVEMIETARILHQATSESLVVLDEVGRGTATFDGLSLAWAIVEHLHGERRPKTLFATHYHELTELAAILPRVVNRTLAVREWEERIVFLRRVVAGSADKSYGIHVARLAGLPPPVVERARQILANLEAQEYDLKGRPRLARGGRQDEPASRQLQLFTPPEREVFDRLRDLEPDALTPRQALDLLYELRERLRQRG